MPFRFTALAPEVDHVIARQHHGQTVLPNLAMACFHCNAHKGPNVAGVDPQTGSIVRLYHPRNDRWADHFAWSGGELIGRTDLRGKRVLDVGCGRGGTVALIGDTFETAEVTGVDLSPEAIAFCRRTHRNPRVRFEVGDAEHLPVENASFDIVTNVESSHTYPNLRAFYAEVARVLAKGGTFLYTDLLPVGRWLEVRALLGPLGLTIEVDREITPNVLASCDEVATTRAQAFGGSNPAIDIQNISGRLT